MSTADERIQKALAYLDENPVRTVAADLRRILQPPPKMYDFGGVLFVKTGGKTPPLGAWGLVDGKPALRQIPADDPYPSDAWINAPILRPAPVKGMGALGMSILEDLASYSARPVTQADLTSFSALATEAVKALREGGA